MVRSKLEKEIVCEIVACLIEFDRLMWGDYFVEISRVAFDN